MMEQFAIFIQQKKKKQIELEAKKEMLNQFFKNEKEKLEETKSQFDLFNKSHAVVSQLTDARRKYIKSKLENIVTKALQYILSDEYSIKFNVRILRGNWVVEPILIKNEIELGHPADSIGGGVLNIIGVATQIMCIVLDGKTQIYLMDERFKSLSEEFRQATSEFIADISKELDIQIIAVSHQQEMREKADRIIEVTNENNISKVRIIK